MLARLIVGAASALAQVARFYQWGESLLASLASMLLYSAASGGENLLPVALGLSFHFATGAYAFYLNQLTDVREDVASRKVSPAQLFGPRRRFGIALFLLLIFLAIAALGALWYTPLAGGAGLLIVLLVTFYSLPPVRFKERPPLDVLSVALLLWTTPFLFFVLLGPVRVGEVIAWSIWLFLAGLMDGLAHVVEDYPNDQKAGVKTSATRFGISRAHAYGTTVAALAIVTSLALAVVLSGPRAFAAALVAFFLTLYRLVDTPFAIHIRGTRTPSE